MFNEYIWQNYLNAGGRTMAALFEHSLSEGISQNYMDTVGELRRTFCPERAVVEGTSRQLHDLSTDLMEDLALLDPGEYTIESALQFLFARIQEENHLSAQGAFAYFSDFMEYLTTLLSVELPGLFVPYYFKYNYNVFEKIAQAFEIAVPPVPVKNDYTGRFFFYGRICEALLDFREKYHLTPYELCAFLYDFAPKYIGGTDSYIIQDLPDPKSAFFIGGSKSDRFLVDPSDAVLCWQCNPETRAGDMIVMYQRSPVSAVVSIWRSVSIGFIDPFFYYYQCTYISNPIEVPKITRKQLQTDDIFKDLPIVRKNMQGINGVELLPSQYNHLVDLTGAKVPKLEFIITSGDQKFFNEKDVEKRLIKPLIAQLGYSEDEYVQQLYMEIGNHNHALIPDFVLLPNFAKGHQSAFALIEAKYSISSQRELEEVQIQARSYARQLTVKYAVIASKEKVRVYAKEDDFTQEVFRASWEELNNADTFSVLLKQIGKEAGGKPYRADIRSGSPNSRPQQ